MLTRKYYICIRIVEFQLLDVLYDPFRSVNVIYLDVASKNVERVTTVARVIKFNVKYILLYLTGFEHSKSYCIAHKTYIIGNTKAVDNVPLRLILRCD